MSEGPVRRITQPMLAVLEVLLDAEGHELHGWAIMKTTSRSGPTVYKILERLAEAEWLTSRWEAEPEPGRPRRRYYRLTGHGVVRARALISQHRSERPSTRLRHAFGCGAV